MARNDEDNILRISGGRAQWGPPLMKRLKRTITSEEILSLASSPVILIEAVEDVALIPVFAFWFFHVGNTGYAGTNNDVMIGFPEGNGYVLNCGTGAWIRTITDDFGMFNSLANTFGDTDTVVGLDLKLYTNENPTSGDGTFDLIVYYLEVSSSD